MVADGYKKTEIGVIPVEWEIVKLDEISKMTMGQSPKSDTYNTNNIGMPLIQGNADCKNRKTIPRTYTTELTKECFVGDIIMTVRAPVGAISKSLHNACIGRGVCSIKSKEDNEYIYHCLVNYEDRWDKLSQGSTFTAVSGNDIKNLKIPLPPLKEQEKIADILSTADEKIDAIEGQIQKAETLKKGLLQKLLSEGIGHSEFKDSELGKIPESWEVVKLNDISKIVDSLHLTPSFVENGISMVRVSDIKLGNLNLNDTLKVTEDTFATFTKNYTPKKGDIVLSRVGSYGVSSYVSTNKPFCMGQNTVVINPIINSKFTYFNLNSIKIFKQIEIASYGSGYKSLSLKNIKELKIPLPPLKEQKQIADILSTADEKLEVLRAKKEKYETLKKGLLQKLLSGEIRV